MRKYILLSIVAFVGLLTAAPARATTYSVPCSGGADIYSAAQGDINSASNGDIVSIGSGSCSLSKPLAWTDKNITVQGAGIGQTNITFASGGVSCSYFGSADAFCIRDDTGTPGKSSANTNVNKVSWRVSGMTITGTPGSSDSVIYVEDSFGNATPIQGWRIDHVDIETSVTPTSSLRPIMVVGISWGLIDHITLNYNGGIGIELRSMLNSEYNGSLCNAQAYEGNTSWALPLHPGSDEAVYIEDSTFTTNIGMGGNPYCLDQYYGASSVFRHNTVNYSGVYVHTTAGTNGRGGSRWFEYYDNTFNGSASIGSGQPIETQGNGTGVIFNNTITGYINQSALLQSYRAWNMQSVGQFLGNCQPIANYNGCNNIATSHGYSFDGFIEASGWPCLDQPGRGSGLTIDQIIAGSIQPSVPILAWNNGTNQGCSAGGSCDNSVGIGLNTACTGNGCVQSGYQLSDYIKTTAHSNGDKDYCVGTTMPTTCGTYTNNYVPYVYPHPCQTNWPACSGGPTPTPTPQPDTTPPSAPTGVRVS